MLPVFQDSRWSNYKMTHIFLAVVCANVKHPVASRSLLSLSHKRSVNHSHDNTVTSHTLYHFHVNIISKIVHQHHH